MKRNLLSSAIIIALMTIGSTGCDDKKTEQETAAPASTPSTAAKPAPAKPDVPAKPQINPDEIFNEKMGVYIKCYNELQIPVHRSLARYASWLHDFKKGPQGTEKIVYGIYGISKSSISSCQAEMKQVLVLKPVLEPIDGVAGNYIDAAVALGNTINEMDDYYTQENYKDDKFVKGKALHQTLLKNIEAFEPVSTSYYSAIQEINDRRQLEELKKIEEREGKSFHYYSLAVMITSKQINAVISQETFDAEAALKKVAELEALVAQLKEADKGGMNFGFIHSAQEYQLAAKKYVRRIRDNVPYSEGDKEQLQDANAGWMVEDSYPAALKCYNEMVNSYNLLR